MSVQIRTLVRSGMLAPAGKPAANMIGRDVCGCRTASSSTRSALTVCDVSLAVASGCIVFVMTAGGGEAVVSSRLAAAVEICWTIDTSPATVSFSELMSAAMSVCGLSAAGLRLETDAGAAGGELVRRGGRIASTHEIGCFRFADMLRARVLLAVRS